MPRIPRLEPGSFFSCPSWTPSPSIHNLYGPFFSLSRRQTGNFAGRERKSATRAITAAIWGIIAYKNRGGREVAAAAFSRLANTGLDSEKKWQGRVVRIQPQESPFVPPLITVSWVSWGVVIGRHREVGIPPRLSRRVSCHGDDTSFGTSGYCRNFQKARHVSAITTCQYMIVKKVPQGKHP